MIFYAIRHKPSGSYLPHAHGTKTGSGFTFVEPTKEQPPRLFMTEVAARKALKWWLKGWVTPKKPGLAPSYVGLNGEVVTFETVSPFSNLEAEKKPARKTEDMAVVQVAVVME